MTIFTVRTYTTRDAVEIEAEWENSLVSTSANACLVKTKAVSPTGHLTSVEIPDQCSSSQHTATTINNAMINYEYSLLPQALD